VPTSPNAVACKALERKYMKLIAFYDLLKVMVIGFLSKTGIASSLVPTGSGTYFNTENETINPEFYK
jgi:hypothetical protein